MWKVTPLFAEWITKSSNILFKHVVLDAKSTVLELGCGISGIIGLSLGPLIESCVVTDQDYVMKPLNQNLAENHRGDSASSKSRKGASKQKKRTTESLQKGSNIIAKPLDWETDEVTPSLTGSKSKNSFDVVIACDCIYNDALVEPLVQTCIDACKLRVNVEGENPAVCVVAQQLRSNEVFEGWLKAFHQAFRVWRLPDEELIEGLKSDTGFVVHLGILR